MWLLVGRDPRDVASMSPTGGTPTIARLLAEGAAVATVAVPPGTPRELALGHITAAFVDLLRGLPLGPLGGLLHRPAHGMQRPGTLIVSGGETLRALCIALAADRLDVDGEIEPGVPTSVLRGGAFDGQRIVSKSGAFGGANFLARRLTP
jgi:D-threonate/D-erythronate kinase